MRSAPALKNMFLDCIRKIIPANCTHILQKAFFKHALSQKRSRFSKYGRSALFNRIKGVPCFNYEYPPDGL